MDDDESNDLIIDLSMKNFFAIVYFPEGNPDSQYEIVHQDDLVGWGDELTEGMWVGVKKNHIIAHVGKVMSVKDDYNKLAADLPDLIQEQKDKKNDTEISDDSDDSDDKIEVELNNFLKAKKAKYTIKIADKIVHVNRTIAQMETQSSTMIEKREYDNLVQTYNDVRYRYMGLLEERNSLKSSLFIANRNIEMQNAEVKQLKQEVKNVRSIYNRDRVKYEGLNRKHNTQRELQKEFQNALRNVTKITCEAIVRMDKKLKNEENEGDEETEDEEKEDEENEGEDKEKKDDENETNSLKPTTNFLMHNSSELDKENIKPIMVTIGFNGTQIPRTIYNSINWATSSQATRDLLMAIFPREVLATHSLTGKPSPLFQAMNPLNKAKEQLNPKITQDIVDIVMRKSHVSEWTVRTAITNKCADEYKLFRRRMEKLQAVSSAQEDAEK